MVAPNNEAKARELGGERLVRFFDLVQQEQRKRWNVPPWREQKLIDADLVNWKDVSRALELLEESTARWPWRRHDRPR
jgi:hypothetical protein